MKREGILVNYERERVAAIEAVRRAGRLCKKIQSDMIGDGTIIKGDRSPVTVADYSAQAIICKMIGDTFSGDSIVGEEDSGEMSQSDNKEILEKVVLHVKEEFPHANGDEICRWIDMGGGHPEGRFWTLDPIDGTKGFIRKDQYAVALALIEDGEIKVGALACPNLPFEASDQDGPRGVIFAAVSGGGAVMCPIGGGDMADIKVTGTSEGSGARMVEGVEAAHSNHGGQSAVANSLGITRESVRLDSQAKYGVVARGEADIYIRMPSPKTPDYREKIWDHAAGKIVVEEAGGRVTDIFGKDLDFTKGRKLIDNRGVLVSNGSMHDKILHAIQKNMD